MTVRVDTQAAKDRDLRDTLIAAVNGNPISADDAWALIHRWDALVALLADTEKALRRIEGLPADPTIGITSVGAYAVAIAKDARAAFDADSREFIHPDALAGKPIPDDDLARAEQMARERGWSEPSV